MDNTLQGRREYELPTPTGEWPDEVWRRHLGNPDGLTDFSQRGRPDDDSRARRPRRVRMFDREWQRSMAYWRDMGNI